MMGRPAILESILHSGQPNERTSGLPRNSAGIDQKTPGEFSLVSEHPEDLETLYRGGTTPPSIGVRHKRPMVIGLLSAPPPVDARQKASGRAPLFGEHGPLCLGNWAG
jgi:hypothetical protein